MAETGKPPEVVDATVDLALENLVDVADTVADTEGSEVGAVGGRGTSVPLTDFMVRIMKNELELSVR